MAVAGEQPHALAVALNDQAITVVFDFVDPVRADRHLGSGRRDAGFKGVHGRKIVTLGFGHQLREAC